MILIKLAKKLKLIIAMEPNKIAFHAVNLKLLEEKKDKKNNLNN
jgi:hypothetical protein